MNFAQSLFSSALCKLCSNLLRFKHFYVFKLLKYEIQLFLQTNSALLNKQILTGALKFQGCETTVLQYSLCFSSNFKNKFTNLKRLDDLDKLIEKTLNLIVF